MKQLPPPERKIQLNLDKREGKIARKAPTYTIIPLIAAHIACGASQNAQKTAYIFLSLKAVLLVGVRL
jgi:hypothetical protein